jgi:hypothetical protein
METCANAMASALRWRLMLGGSRFKRVTFVLGDEAKLAVFRDVAVEALRGAMEGNSGSPEDVGLPDDRKPVTEDAATCLDVSGATGRR